MTVDQAQSVTALFTLVTHTLTVDTTGAGSGSVKSNPAGIDCGESCTAEYDHNTLVVLTATPQTGSIFAGWSGACSGTAVCTVTINQAQVVTATFEIAPPNSYILNVTLSGSGDGAVTSDPAGIACGSSCAAVYSENTLVMLTATAAAGSTFAGWGGTCAAESSNVCTVTMDMAHTVSASFHQEDGFSYTIFSPMVTRP